MKRNLTLKETVVITSMLFGMFFGAGNLIFPAKVGLDAGSNMWSAFAGVFITAVGIPMLAVVGLGLSRSEGVVELSQRVSRKYSLFFCTLLYLTIGPLFAIPRGCGKPAASGGGAAVSGTVLPGLLCRGALFLPEARWNHDLDRKMAESGVPGVSGSAGHCRPGKAHQFHFRRDSGRKLRFLRLRLLPGLSGGL